MKLKIKETAWLGDPGVGSELSFKTHGRIFDIEIVKEKMSFQGMDFGIRPAIFKATTTSAEDFKSWEQLDEIGIDTGHAGIWDDDAPVESEWSNPDADIYVSNQNDDVIDGIIMTSGLGDGIYPVYVKKENGEITDFVIDFRD